jgi:hypothetical protein
LSVGMVCPSIRVRPTKFIMVRQPATHPARCARFGSVNW